MDRQTTKRPPSGALRPAPVFAAWISTVGIDLFFNAGVFSPLFDETREPNLLSDDALFRRIPVAYIGLLVAVVGLAWVVDRLEVGDRRSGAALGFGAGVVLTAMGVVSLWTAIDMTFEFVAAAVVVQIAEMTGAGAALGAISGSARSQRTIRTTIGLAIGAAIIAIVIQNSI